MRKKMLLLVMALLSLSAVQAQQPVGQKPIEADPTNLNPVNSQMVLENFAREQAAKSLTTMPFHKFNAPKFPMRKAAGAVEYYVAAQSHSVDGTFVYEGGDFQLWSIDVTIDGTNVTFDRLFNVEFFSPDYNPYVDVSVTGVYDAEDKTVTIDAPTGASGTVVATGNGSFLTVISGDVNESGQLSPDNKLVFDVLTDDKGNITCMTARKAIVLPTYYGSYSYGNNAVYRQFIINLPGDEASLLATKSSIDLGETFVGEEITGQMEVMNLGGATASFVVDVECEPEGYIVTQTPTGEIAPGETRAIAFTLKGIDLNDDVEGIASIAYEGVTTEGIFDVVLHGRVVSAPDFSPVVKNGEFTFKTNIDAPWDVVTDGEGVTWAKSGATGRKAISDLYVNFTVPEGQIGTLTWTGQYKNNPAFRYSFYNLAGWFVDTDGLAEVALQYEGEANGEKEFGPGNHFVRFQQQSQYASPYEDDGLYIRDLNLDLVQPGTDIAEVKTPVVNFGFFILEDGGGIDGDQKIIIQNRGSNKLVLKSVTCDNDEFMAETSEVEEAGTLQDLVIPVYLSTRTSGTKIATFTIETSAGTFTVVAKAKVYDQPDFSQIVVEGAEYITFEINPESPYIVENGVAYNVDCESEDFVASSSDSYVNGTDLTLSFDIPEGKIGYITWEGTIWGDPIDNESYSHIYGDYGIVYIQHYPLNGYGNFGQMQAYADDLENGGDASSRLFSNDDFWASYLVNEPGSHSITFRYYHNGDGVTYGKNRFEISNIRLHVEDFNEYGAELLAEGPIEFEPTYVGFNRYTTANVTLKNTGSMPLSVTGFEAEGENSPFVSILPTYDASFNSTLDVTLVFYPGVKLDANGNVVSVDTTVGLKDTWFTDKVTIKTTAGDFSLDVKGMAKSSEGILLIGDFEDDAYGWDRFDQDGDNKMWDLGTSFWWYERPEYCHSGVQCIASASSDSGQALTPDNWVVSPSFTVPEDGAMLTWWAGSLHNSLCAEHYSVYIEEDFSNPSKFNGMTPVFSETLEVDPDAEYHEHQLDLSDYVGKTVRVAFRHHDCTNQYLLRIDDVFVYTMDKWDEIATSINGMATSNDIVSRQFFNAAGQRVSAPVNGVNIVRQTMNDGSVKAVKVMNK